MSPTKRPPDEDAPDPAPASSVGPFMAPSGMGSVVPRPLGVGRPKAEPEERWTLGPSHHEPAAGDTELAGGSDAAAPADGGPDASASADVASAAGADPAPRPG